MTPLEFQIFFILTTNYNESYDSKPKPRRSRLLFPKIPLFGVWETLREMKRGRRRNRSLYVPPEIYSLLVTKRSTPEHTHTNITHTLTPTSSFKRQEGTNRVIHPFLMEDKGITRHLWSNITLIGTINGPKLTKTRFNGILTHKILPSRTWTEQIGTQRSETMSRVWSHPISIHTLYNKQLRSRVGLGRFEKGHNLPHLDFGPEGSDVLDHL